MSEAYYRKWRPLDWDHVVGQEHVTQTIKNAIRNQRNTHAYLFSGPRGTGKTSTARILAKAVNCLSEDKTNSPCNTCENCEAINAGRFLDLIEIDAASNTSVDDVRSLREKINFSPSKGQYKVYIIDEVHMLSNAAFNALLKTLEEPPDHAIFVLATTEVHKIPPTVLSRCQRHEFRRIPINSIQANLKEIAESEKIDIEPSALTEIARQATGSMRDAVSLLDQLASTGNKVTLTYAKDVLGTASNENVVAIARALSENDAGKGIEIINQSLDDGSDPRQFGRQVVDFMRMVLMVKMGNIEKVDLPNEMVDTISNLADNFDLQHLVQIIENFDQSTMSTSLGWQPSLKLELAAMGSCEVIADQKEKDLPAKRSPVSKVQPSSPSEEPSKIVHEKKEKKIHKTEKPKQELATNLSEKKEIVDFDSNDIQSYWDEIRKAAKAISAETAALLNSCKTVNLQNEKLILTFSGSILQSKMENGDNKANTQLAVKRVTGNDIDVICKVAAKNSAQKTLAEGVDQDGMIGAALSLGGKMTKEE